MHLVQDVQLSMTISTIVVEALLYVLLLLSCEHTVSVVWTYCRGTIQ